MKSTALLAVAFARTEAFLRSASKHDQSAGVSSGQYPQKFVQLMRNHNDTQYTGEITIGNQVLDALIDTGSYALVVLATSCGEACGASTKTLYDHSLSPTYRAGPGGLRRHYAMGDIFANDAFDDVRVGPMAIPGMHFQEGVGAEMPLLPRLPFGVILGAGPPSGTPSLEARATDNTSFLGHGFAMGDNDISGPEFFVALGIRRYSVCIGRQRGSPGYFIWNDIAPEDHAASQGAAVQFTDLPVLGQAHWTSSLSNVRMAGSQEALGCSPTGCAGVVDSGTSLIHAPRSAVEALLQSLKGLRRDCSNLRSMPPLVFELGGHEFSLPPEAYIAQIMHKGFPRLRDILHLHFRSKNYECVPLIRATDIDTQFGPMWILGLPFFRKYYTTHTFDRSESASVRHLSVAVADEGCNPTNELQLVRDNTSSAQPISIDGSLVRLPQWIIEAEDRKYITI